MTFHVIRSCKACQVDVSVPQEEDDPRCPRCGDELGWPTNPQGDAADKTLLEVRPTSGSDLAARPSGSDLGSDLGEGPTGTIRQDPAELAATVREPPPSTSAGVHPSATGAAASRPRPADSDEHSGLAETATFPGGGIVAAGRRLGAYELRRVLGKGGMGIVYEAFHTDLQRVVALKVMSGGDGSEEEFLRFKREARAAAKLQHPNIVPILEVGEAEGQHFFTMELVKGSTLQALARHKALSPEESARVMAKVARAIDYAHERQIIHRDLKPSNVLIDEEGEPHVMDFGLAKDLTDVSGLTLTGIAMGSPPYMPPEQARGEFRDVDEVSDVYALGATLYECLAGKPPFGGKSLYDVIAKVLVEDPPAPRTLNPEVGYDLETICLKALEKEKWRRYPTAASMADDLERALQGLSIRAVRQGLTTRVARMIRRHQFQLFSLLIPIIVCGAVIAYTVGGSAPASGIESTGGHRYEVKAGPLARTAEHLANNEDAAAIQAVLNTRPASLPSWQQVEQRLEPLLKHRKVARALATERDAALAKGTKPTEPAAPRRLASIIWELIREQEIPHATLGALVTDWLAEAPALAELTRRTVLAVRGSWSRTAAPYAAIFAGERKLTILDRAILTGAAQVLYGKDAFEEAKQKLTPEGSPQSQLALLPSDPRYSPIEQAIVASDAARPWVFPEVRAPGVAPHPKRPRPLLRGLLRPSANHGLMPTTPLRTATGEHVAVAWVRFVYLLADRDGSVVARARLPGLAEALHHEPGGGFRVRVWSGGVAEWVRVQRAKGGLKVTRPDGAALPLARLQAPSDDALPDQLEREARSLFPEFEEVLEFTRIEKAADGTWRELLTRIDLARPELGSRLDVGFRQADPDRTPRCPNRQLREDPLVPQLTDPREIELRRITQVDPRVTKAFRLKEGDLLHRWSPKRRSYFSRGRYSVTVAALRQADGITWRLAFSYAPFFKLTTPDLERVIDAGAEHLARHPDPNPWVRALRVAALVLHARAHPEGAEAQAEVIAEEAKRAISSPYLTPLERVKMGCFLDRYGVEAPADEAFQRALLDLVHSGAFLPGWAGYGPLDCGRMIADRVDECLSTQPLRPERSRTLARWRNAFAPVLNESTYAADGYRRKGQDLKLIGVPETRPPPPPWPEQADPPPKGVGGMTALDLIRVDQLTMFERFFAMTLISLLLVTLVRCRAHVVRDLRLLGASTAFERIRLWWERPGVRLRHAWFTYLTLQDRLAFLFLLLLYFLVFATQDAWLDVVASQRNARASLLAGNPGEAVALSQLEGSFEREPTPEVTYTLCWLRAARKLEPHAAALEALRQQRTPRAQLLLAEIELQAGDRAAARAALEALGSGTELEARRAAVEARQSDPNQLVPEALAKQSVRLSLARWAKQPALLSPAPTPQDRDRILLGAESWTDPIPWLAVRDFFQPFPGSFDASIAAFNRHTHWRVSFLRYENPVFFLIPLTIVVLFVSLLFPGLHEFEPLESDIARPGPVKRLARLLFPGLPQLLRGKPIRGALLLTAFAHVAHAIVNLRAGFQVAENIYYRASLRSALMPSDQAQLTAEVLSAFPVIHGVHMVNLAVLLLVIYSLHWVDLAVTQRKQLTDQRPDRGARPDVRSDPSRFIIPLDSEPAIEHRPDSVDGPFDATERDI